MLMLMLLLLHPLVSFWAILSYSGFLSKNVQDLDLNQTVAESWETRLCQSLLSQNLYLWWGTADCCKLMSTRSLHFSAAIFLHALGETLGFFLGYSTVPSSLDRMLKNPHRRIPNQNHKWLALCPNLEFEDHSCSMFDSRTCPTLAARWTNPRLHLDLENSPNQQLHARFGSPLELKPAGLPPARALAVQNCSRCWNQRWHAVSRPFESQKQAYILPPKHWLPPWSLALAPKLKDGLLFLSPLIPNQGFAFLSRYLCFPSWEPGLLH